MTLVLTRGTVRFHKSLHRDAFGDIVGPNKNCFEQYPRLIARQTYPQFYGAANSLAQTICPPRINRRISLVLQHVTPHDGLSKDRKTHYKTVEKWVRWFSL